MRGYSQSGMDWPKADQVEKAWTTQSCPAFCPPALPKQLPVDNQLTRSDDRAIKRQKSYAAPAHVVSHLMDSLSEGALIPLARAAAANNDPFIEEQLASVHEFISGQTAYQLGLAVRSLAASYNTIATERKDALLRSQTPDIKRALEHMRPGFDRFFSEDISQALSTASQTAQMKLTQATLASLAKITAQKFPRQTGPRDNNKPYYKSNNKLQGSKYQGKSNQRYQGGDNRGSQSKFTPKGKSGYKGNQSNFKKDYNKKH